MTLEEAIKLLKQYQGYEPISPDGETLKHAFDLTDETVDTLLTALRPVSRVQIEQNKRRWEIQTSISPYYYCSGCGESFEIHSYDKGKYRFCPYCMSPMTDEAVEIMLKRMEALLND